MGKGRGCDLVSHGLGYFAVFILRGVLQYLELLWDGGANQDQVDDST